MEELGRFSETSPYRGQSIDYTNGRFSIRGSGDVDVRLLLEMDGRGEVLWRDEGVRRWVHERAASTVAPPPAPASASPKFRSPAMIAVTVLVAIAVLGACALGVFLLFSPTITWDTGGNGGTGGSGVQGQYEVFDTCEIMVVTSIGEDMNSPYQGVFVARIPPPYDDQIDNSDTLFSITEQEYIDSTMDRTPEREAAVGELAGKLTASGWKQIGQGADWYSLKFGR